MKKTRKLLSIVLSVLVVFASLPVVYTAAADTVTYAAGETGTIDNPTHPVSADGVFSYDDLYKLNIDVENTKYTFYQTMNDEYFTYTQILGLQQRNDVPISGRTFNFVGVEHYTGGTNATTTNADGSAQGTDLMEVPAITTNTTADFLNTYYVPTHTWAPINNNATNDFQGKTEPTNVQLAGSVADLLGCKNYSWSDTYVIKGLSASEKGEVNTGYYESYKWNWSTRDASAAFELRLKTSIRILDAREFVKELAEAEAVLANPDKYTQAYLSSVKATLNTIPEDLKDLSEVYSQSDIDKYTKMLKDVSLNSADYTEFNRTYENLKGITNAIGGFTDDSFADFKTEIEKINNNLPKNLDYTKQSVVDEATQALRDAYNLLVTKGDASGGTYTETIHDIKFTIQNEFNLIQIKDDQILSYTQNWIADRRNLESKDSRRMFYSVIDSSSTFASRFTDAAVDTVSSLSAKAIDGSLSNALIFTCWEEVLADGSLNPTTEVISRDTHTIDGNYAGFQKDKAYYIENSPTFRGLSASETGAHTFTFNQKIYLNWQQNILGFLRNNFTQTAFVTTINITDARPLVKAVAEANATIANPGSYSDNYISALQAAVDAVPVNLIRGVEYYTQEEVDAYLNAITSVQEGCADYSEFNEAYEELINMKNNSTYTDESYSAFMEEIQSINKNLPKNLTADQQATVDAATEALHKATHHLVYYKLNTDNVFTEEDIPEDLGFSPLVFSVSSTRYEFMQVSDGQQFAIRTDFSARNNDSSYTLRLLSFGFSTVNAGNVTDICAGRTTPDKGCHNAANVPELNFFDLATYASTSGNITGITSYTADDAGDTGEFNSWVNTDGVNLSSGGVFIDGAVLELYDSTGYATYVYTATSGENQENININYAFRLGWSYEQFWGETIRRHAHIPVSLTITDARALHNLYNEVEDILNGETDKSYTLSSLVTLYNAFNNVPSDMASGEAYYTQSEVNAKYDELKAAYDTLVEGADYSEFFEAYVKAQEIINTNNKDSAGNSLYDDAAYETFNQQFTDIITGLDMNLPASEQTTVNDATTALNNALAALEATKRADYSEFNDALAEVEKILKEEQENPGTYTQSSLEAIQNAYNDAVALDKGLPASEQATVDAVTDALKAAAENKKYKADYSEFDDAYSKVQDIFNNPNKYTDETVDAAERALEEADKLNKDLPDTEENRTTIENATNALENVFNNAKESADYTAFEEAYKKVQEIAENKDGKYTQSTVTAAQNALAEADKLDKNLEKNDANQDIITDATNALQSVIDGAKEKANYDAYNNAKAEADAIINSGNVDENGNTIYDEAVFEAYKEAVNKIDTELVKDLPSDEQEIINNAVTELENLKTELENNKKADYTDFNTAKDALEEIVNAPAGTYTDETVQKAQTALDNANQIPDNLVVGENNVNQDMIDNATQNMQDVVDSAEKKADYTEFDKAVEDLENIVNAPEGTYTDETVKNAQDALDSIVDVDKDMADTEQGILDEITSGLKDVVDSAENKADYTDYNNTKSEADSLVNDDGNGNPIYDEDAFDAYKDAVNKIDNELDKDLPASEQSKVDDAANALDNALNTLEASKYYTVTFLDAEGNFLSAERFVSGAVFGTIAVPQLPESTDEIAVVGWAYENDTIAGAEDVLTSDVTVKVAAEDKVLRIFNESGLSFDAETGYIVTELRSLTVADVLAKFDNDATLLTVADFEGNVLSADDYVGSGAVITLSSKYTNTVYESRTFVIYGDVTGDGLVNADDYAVARSANIIPGSYNESNHYFFVANDVAKDGYIDALDTAYINLMVKGYK